MRSFLNHVALGLVAMIPLFGCNHTPIIGDRANPPAPATDTLPEADRLVNYLNENAKRVQSVRAKIDMDCKAGGQSIALGGNMACQKPRNFRLKGNVLGQPAVDMGSNSRRFWYWISKADPPTCLPLLHNNLMPGPGPHAVPVPAGHGS